ncbi:preprotein translocase subunit TatC [Candidatus Saccharibacteria bacterium]|nr:preprotein translocase subunit TatC [Candidatus Saccharibacteria bacterium]
MGEVSKHSRTNTTTLNDHLRELQVRLVVCAVALLIAGIVVYMFYGPILAFLSSPLNAPLYYTSPAGGFTYVMKICVAGALIVTVPIIFFNLIMFVRPAFEKVLSMKRVFTVTIFSSVLAVAGAAFAFYCILPGSLQFFKGFQVSGLNALISADSYLGFLTSMIAMFVIVFQIPLIIAFIDTIHPLSPRQLLRLEKWVVIGSLVVALLAPFTYDFVTSILIAVPIIVLYNLSIIIVVMRHKRKNSKNKATARSQELATKPEPINTSAHLPPTGLIGSTNDVATEYPNLATPVTVYRKTTMDICRPAQHQRPITQVAWSQERVVKRVQLSRKVNLISDIKVPPRANHISI